MTLLHIFRVQIRRTHRQWWVCDQDGTRLLKSSRPKLASIKFWTFKFNRGVETTKPSIRYEGIMRPSEVAMMMMDLRQRS